MKIKKILIIVISLALVGAFVIGVTGTVSLSERDSEPYEIETGSLIGLYVMFEYKDLSELVNDGEKYLYATKREIVEDGCETVEYVFEQLDGLPFYHINYLDNGNSVGSVIMEGISQSFLKTGNIDGNLSGTLYLSQNQDLTQIWTYRVYQMSDERVYIDPNELCDSFGFPYDYAITMSETDTLTQDGEDTTNSFSVTLNIKSILTPDNTVKLIEMNANSEVVKETVISLNEEISDYVLSSDTEYVIAEQQTKDGNDIQTNRKLCSRGDSSVEVFTAKDELIYLVDYIRLVWQ